MTEYPTKKILFNKSTLLTLKAELIKKQVEVQEKKNLPQHRAENHKPNIKNSNKNDDKESAKADKRNFKDSLKAIDTEEFEACRKSRIALEKKAELYEHLSDSTGSSQLAGQFLVDFKSKKQDTPQTEHSIQPMPEPPDDIEKQEKLPEYDDESEWMEYTDSLGRSRKCLKTELEFYMKRDRELQKAMAKHTAPEEVAINDHEELNKPTEKPLLVQKTHDYLQSLRQKWEEKEKELLAKNKDIHYQDVLFDEARMHGVGYYSFSTDEAERLKQMEELKKQREETVRAQKRAEDARQKREELVAARVAAARARQRARAGLPPEEPKENENDFTACLLQFLTQQKNEADAKAKEKEEKIKEEQEKERQKLRDAYIRDWDRGKEGVDDKVKKFREMSQEEYVEQQRDKRIDEFAPISTASSSRIEDTFDSHGRRVSNGDSLSVNKTWADVRAKVETPAPPDISDYNVVDDRSKGLFFSSSKNVKGKSQLKYKNFVQTQEPTPIVNEISDDNGIEVEKMPHKRVSSNTEIPPPPTFEYYGPVVKQAKTNNPFDSDVNEAYAQGKKSLESKESSRKIAKDYDFSFE